MSDNITTQDNIYFAYAHHFVSSPNISDLIRCIEYALPNQCEICKATVPCDLTNRSSYSLCLLCIFICGEKMNKLLPRDRYMYAIYHELSKLSIKYSTEPDRMILQCDSCYLYRHDIRVYGNIRVCSRCYHLATLARCWRYLRLIYPVLPLEIVMYSVELLQS